MTNEKDNNDFLLSLKKMVEEKEIAYENAKKKCLKWIRALLIYSIYAVLMHPLLMLLVNNENISTLISAGVIVVFTFIFYNFHVMDKKQNVAFEELTKSLNYYTDFLNEDIARMTKKISEKNK